MLVGAGNKIAADKIVFEYESTIAVDLASLPTGNTAAALILEGTLFLQDGYGSMINLPFLNPVCEN